MKVLSQNRKLSKCGMFTDIHFGRKNNSEVHNLDCMNFIKWFIKSIEQDATIDHINFLGDWFESRSAINGLTLDISYECARLLNDMDMPIFFIVGNHDLHYKNNRKIFNTKFLENFKNFTIINEPTIIRGIGNIETLYTPFLFHDEYDILNTNTQASVCFGHLEFNGFIITGNTITMKGAVDHKKYKKFKKIITGHYHKRQSAGNVNYIASAFPMDYSDANDIHRGLSKYDHITDSLTFIDWPDCPLYIKTKVSELKLNYSSILKKDATVECLLDEEISYDDITNLLDLLRTKFSLRAISFIEPDLITDIQEGSVEDIDNMMGEPIDIIIKKIITDNIDVDSINNEMLYTIYEELEHV